MTALVIAVGLVAVTALVVVAVGIVTLLRRTAAPTAEQSRQLLDEARSQAASERDSAIRAALEQSAVLNREALGSQAAASLVELEAKKALIDVRLDQVQEDVGTQLARVETQLADLSRSSAVSLGRVSEQLEQHAASTRSLSETTQGLREALANSKARGQWGERMAEDVLRLAGFVEHINYEKQTAVEGGRSIPDFTFKLPKGHVLYMDVKFPLAAYLRFLNATTDEERTRERAQFLRDVRLKVKDLAKRDYLDPSRVVCDQLLLFIPNETVSAFIYESDPAVIDDALREKIVFCSPLTLFAMLGVIRQAFDSVMIEQTSDEVLRLVGALRSQFDKYTDAVDKLGKRLESVQTAFDDLNGTRRRALERPLAKADELRRERGLAIAPDLAAGADVYDLHEELGA
ncbi:MAG TPA: DNA recombination protein RmuC [Acidimicrobiales bacterium]|nr:DNA recombination protein RmuC [Acidimicrobiales bacterium]